jgi:hypothetical protein
MFRLLFKACTSQFDRNTTSTDSQIQSSILTNDQKKTLFISLQYISTYLPRFMSTHSPCVATSACSRFNFQQGTVFQLRNCILLATDAEVRVRFPALPEVVALERGLLSLVNTIEELLGRKSSGSGLESREYRRRDPSRWPRGFLYPQNLALTSPISSGRSVGIVRSRTQATEFLIAYKNARITLRHGLNSCWYRTYWKNWIILVSLLAYTSTLKWRYSRSKTSVKLYPSVQGHMSLDNPFHNHCKWVQETEFFQRRFGLKNWGFSEWPKVKKDARQLRNVHFEYLAACTASIIRTSDPIPTPLLHNPLETNPFTPFSPTMTHTRCNLIVNPSVWKAGTSPSNLTASTQRSVITVRETFWTPANLQAYRPTTWLKSFLVSWGTKLQVGRSRDRVAMRSLNFF